MSEKDIRFRGKSEKTKELVYGDLVYIFKKPFIRDRKTTDSFAIIPGTEGQYTGVSDRGSFRIYHKQHIIWHQKDGKLSSQ